MYKLDTGQARTDLFGLNKGMAQVFDLSQATDTINRKQAEEERKRAAKLKADQEIQDDVDAQLKGMYGKAIMSHDSPDIAAKQQTVIDFAKKNGNKLSDPNVRMQFGQLMGDLQTTIAGSVDKRQKYESTAQWVAQNSDKIRPDARDKFIAFAGSPYAGQDFNPADYMKENFDTQKYVQNTVRPIAEDIANKGSYEYIDPESGIKTSYTKDNLTEKESEKLFNNTMLKNPQVFDQESYNLSQDEEAQKRFGNDVNAYIKDKYFDSFVINRNKSALSDASGYGHQWNDKDVLNATYQPTDEGKVFTINPNSQKPTTIDINGRKETVMLGEVEQGKDGKVFGKATVQLTPEQKAENQSVRNEAYQKDKVEYVKKVQALKDPAEIAKIPVPVKDDAKYRNMKVPNKDTRNLDYTKTSQILKNTYGIENIYETFNKDQAPATHVDMKVTDTRGAKKEPVKAKYADAKKAYLKRYSITEDQLDEKDLEYLSKFK